MGAAEAIAPARLGAADRRATIIEAGWDLLREGGPQAVQIDAVVERLGVTRPVFYRHFRHRADLVAALYDDYAADLSARTDALSSSELPPSDLLFALFRAYLDCVAERGSSVRALVEYFADEPEVEAARSGLRARQTELISRTLVIRGRTNAPKARLLVRLLNSLAMEAATAWLSGEATRAAIEDLARQVIDSGLSAALTGSASGFAHG